MKGHLCVGYRYRELVHLQRYGWSKYRLETCNGCDIIMVYCTQTEVESHTGFGYSDFMQAGQTMTSAQWATYITSVIEAVSQLINQYCNRTSFEETDIEEFHNGRGPTGDVRSGFPPIYSSLSYRTGHYREIDKTFLPLQQPVISGDAVYVDTTPNDIPTWEKQTKRSSSDAGGL